MSGSKNPPTPDPAPVCSVREAAIKLLADLDTLPDLTYAVVRIDSGLPVEVVESVERLRLALQNERSVPTPIVNEDLVREGIELIERSAPPGELRPEHILAVVEAARGAVEAVRSFDIRHDADMRAIRRWQSAEPSRDVAKLVEAAKALLDDGESRERAALRSAVETVERYSIDGAADRSMIWPDHSDLLVWLLELLEVRPSCPSPDEVDEMAKRLRAVYVASPMISEAVEMMLRLANALIASSRRTVQAESDRAVIPRLIAAWARSELFLDGRGSDALGDRIAERIEAGEWLPLRGAAIRARRAVEGGTIIDPGVAGRYMAEAAGLPGPYLVRTRPGEQVSGCEDPMLDLPPEPAGPSISDLLAHSTATVDLGDGPVQIEIRDGIATLPDGAQHHVRIDRGPARLVRDRPMSEVEPRAPYPNHQPERVNTTYEDTGEADRVGIIKHDRFHDGLRTVLQRPDVKEAIAHAVAVERGADWQAATEAGRNAFREEADRLLAAALAAPRA